MRIIQRQERESGRDYALRTLRANIISLDLPPGSPISENELSAEMGLSRTPVREALIELAKTRIVEIAPQKKSMVALVDYELVEESRFMRNILECAVVELVCAMAGEEDIRQLRENVQMQHFCLDSFRPEQLMELDNRFHQILFRVARKEQIHGMMTNISIHFDRVRNMALSSVKEIKIVGDHADITEAIAQKDAALARQLMEIHLSRYKYDAQAIREQYPDYFSN